MEYKKAVECLNNSTPVIYKEIEYKKINAIIFRININGKKVIQAELQDLKTDSVVICDLEKISEVQEWEINTWMLK